MQAASVALTGFGPGDFSDSGFSSSFSQTGTTTQFIGSDQTGSFSGTFSPVDITGFTSSITLTATVSGTNPASNFTLQLWDGGSNFRDYSGNWSAFPTGVPTIVIFTADTPSVGVFNVATVSGVQFLFGGVGSTLNVTFDTLTANSISAVPEPSICTGLAGLAGLGLAFYRRRAVRSGRNFTF